METVSVKTVHAFVLDMPEYLKSLLAVRTALRARPREEATLQGTLTAWPKEGRRLRDRHVCKDVATIGTLLTFPEWSLSVVKLKQMALAADASCTTIVRKWQRMHALDEQTVQRDFGMVLIQTVVAVLLQRLQV